MVCGLSRLVGFRRSFNSQNNSDSIVHSSMRHNFIAEQVSLGPKDLSRLSQLVLNGDSHAKVTRMVIVWHTLTLPRRVWVDYDTYRIGRADIEYMSDSTMHTIHKGCVDKSDFSEHVDGRVIEVVNECISDYNTCTDVESKDHHFMRIKDNLPEAFLQTRDVMLNYQALRHIYFDRRNHRQPEFKEYCEWIKILPYSKELITVE